MNFNPKKPKTVRNRILDALVNRLKLVVNNYHIRFNETNSIMFRDLTVQGTYIGDPRSFLFEIVGTHLINVFERTKDDSVETPLPQIVWDGTSNPIAIADSGMGLVIGDTSDLPIGDVFEIRFNTCNATLRDSVRYDRIFTEVAYPCAIVLPHREYKEHGPSDRYHSVIKTYITVWFEQEPSEADWFEEFLGDIEDVLMMDVQLGECLSYDFTLDEITTIQDEKSTERSGALLECSIFYRHSDKSTRNPRN